MPALQGELKALEKGTDVLLCRIMVQDMEKQPFEGTIVYD